MATKHFDVSGKVVVLTGAVGLLGLTYAQAFAEAGASIVAIDIVPTAVAKKRLLSRLGPQMVGRVTYFRADIGSKAALLTVRRAVLRNHRRIDVLINNAAITARAEHLKKGRDPFEEFDLRRWNEELRVNLTGTLLCCQVFGAVMRKGASVINISSTYGLVGPDQRIYPRGVVKPVSYCVSKGAIITLTKYLATYWGARGVRVNCVVPHGVRENQSREFVKKYSERTPLGRMATPEEFVGLIVYLSSESSSYCTGGVYLQDGGWTAW